MTFTAQWQLTYDDAFVSRSRACLNGESDFRVNDGRPDIAALAKSLLRDDNPNEWVTFQTMLGAAPGLADKADNGDGTIDSSKITDEEILSNVQSEYPTVAALYYTADGTPI